MTGDAALVVSQLTVPGRLTSVSFTVRKGALHALLGPNGSGKSTVVNCVLGLEAHTGTVTLEAKRLAVVPQRFTHDGAMSLTVRDFLALTRTRRPVALGLSKATRASIDQLLDHGGAAGLGSKLIHQLSGGELRRVLLINALDPLPELLLLDEPEAGLDADSLEWLERTVASLKQKQVTMLLISHDEARVSRLADDVTRLLGGRRV